MWLIANALASAPIAPPCVEWLTHGPFDFVDVQCKRNLIAMNLPVIGSVRATVPGKGAVATLKLEGTGFEGGVGITIDGKSCDERRCDIPGATVVVDRSRGATIQWPTSLGRTAEVSWLLYYLY